MKTDSLQREVRSLYRGKHTKKPTVLRRLWEMFKLIVSIYSFVKAVLEIIKGISKLF